MVGDDFDDIEEILARIGKGDESASAALLPHLYKELRALAGGFFRGAGGHQTLQPTALVHEAFVKLSRARPQTWESRAHFLAVAAMAMRQILANHAERKRAVKRGGDRRQVTLAGLTTSPHQEAMVDLLDLDQALHKLADLAPRQYRVVEMRFLAGLEEREIAHVLGIGLRTVQREWRMARAFLRCELDGEGLS